MILLFECERTVDGRFRDPIVPQCVLIEMDCLLKRGNAFFLSFFHCFCFVVVLIGVNILFVSNCSCHSLFQCFGVPSCVPDVFDDHCVVFFIIPVDYSEPVVNGLGSIEGRFA